MKHYYRLNPGIRDLSSIFIFITSKCILVRAFVIKFSCSNVFDSIAVRCNPVSDIYPKYLDIRFYVIFNRSVVLKENGLLYEIFKRT